ncbi:subclass B3 metallo-beta-lactamase [Sphingobium sp. BYY-5]|uniref:subclass B3 metallo-beta-lactamase n=1 Tax=Sphingobium sp. BYY-5 TaxID=2926400 RepID=UPI001FA6B7B4|nr:subclass B3 metallo-beta-lactamase [Sphingobium sp. BYY-5]MCI4591318.1 subclass B3 metallo-beta-lactamase [Sphingobium sp. BYY-5]
MRKRMVLAISLAGMAVMGAGKPDDPLTRPIAPDYAKRWLEPQPPARLYGTTYLVGFGGLNVALIRTSAGLIMIDGAVPQAVPDIEAKIRQLGFSIKQVKLILSTEPHFDHAGGLAALARDSGATVIASAPAAAVLRQGGGDPDDPQAAWLERFPGVTKLRAVRDGAVIRLGDVAVTAHATPGHTLGSMSWSWKSCEGKACKTIVFASSLNPIAVDGWRFADPAHRRFVDAFRTSFARVKAMRCDMLIASHPLDGDADRLAKLARARTPHPFADPAACRRYAARAEAALEKKLME